MFGKSRLAYVCAFILPFLACLGALADGAIPTPIPPVAPGQPIPPPGPEGCLCRCPGSPSTPEEHWFCGDPCIAIQGGVTVGSLTTWLEDNCFPMLPGVDPAECVDCLAQNLEYKKRWCKCQGEFDCDLNSDEVVDCEDLRLFLDFDRGECISRDQMMGLVCCFLEHVKLETAKGGCDTTFNDGCEAIKACLESGLYKPGDDPVTPEHPVFNPPLSEIEVENLMGCYGCDCCKDVGTHGAKVRDCSGDGPPCDQDGDGDVDCQDLNLFIDRAADCTGVAHDGLTSEQLMDVFCEYVKACVDCEDLGAFIDCLEERLCRVLTASEMAALQACLGEKCTVDDCCKTISASTAWGGSSETTASYAACGGTIRCDQNCDHTVDCADLVAFLAEAQSRCPDGDPWSREKALLLTCAFARECANEELCSCLVEALNGYFAGQDEPLQGDLTSTELGHLADCLPCGDICPPGDGHAEPGEGCGSATQPPTGDCDCGGSGAKSAPATTAQGVVPPTGAATTQGTDAVVQVPGPDFALQRAYSSDPSYESSCATGKGWSQSQFQHADHDAGAGTLTLNLDARRRITVDVSSGAKVTDSSTGLDFWRVPGNGTLLVHKALATYGSTTYAVWRLREPGGASTDYIRQPDAGETTATPVDPALAGQIAGVTDVYAANTHRYEYGIWVGTGGTPVARLKRVWLNPGAGSAPPAARVDFSYLWGSGVNAGRLRQASVYRPDSQGAMTLVEQVDYRYIGADDVSACSTDCGTDGDLVLVVHRERVDPSPDGAWPMWRDRVTHYRYHGGTSGLSGAAGAAHQLKMTILPEQVEFAASAWADDVNGPTGPVTTTTTATQYAQNVLLGKTDVDPAWGSGGEEVAALASQVNLTYSPTGSKPVTTVWSQAACGCSGPGGSTHRVYTYSYIASTSGRATVSVDETPGPTAGSLRRFWYETYAPSGSGPQYLRSHAVEELDDASSATTHRAWVTWYDHDSTSHMLVRERMPSTFPNGIGTSGSYDYQPGTSGSAPVYATSATGGLSRRYAYVASSSIYGYRLLASQEVGQGASPSAWILTDTYEYGDLDGAGSGWTSSNSRDWLLSRARRYRTTGGTGSAATDIEETTCFYGFASTGSPQVMWQETRVEAEAIAENGPGRTYASFELYDTQGQNTWSVAADMAVTKRVFGSLSGQYAVAAGMPQEITRNAATTGLSSPYYGLTTSGFGRNSSGGALTTSYRRDLLGRVIETLGPGGVSTFTMRYMDAYATRPAIPSYVELTLPHQWLDGTAYQSAGAASATWTTASGRALGTSEYAVKPVLYTMSTGGSSTSGGWSPRVSQYALGDELGRRVTRYRYNGLVESQDYWAQLATDAPFGGAFSTIFHYDALGRLDMRAAANGTVTGYEYDVLDRVVRTSTDVLGSGAAWPSTLTATMEYGYDGGTPSTPAIGDGNLTTQTALIGSGMDRTTTYTYDFRDRRTITQNPAAPHELVVYDNLDRVVQRGVFSSVPTSMTSTNRGSYTETAYSQRGLVYRTRMATVPSSSSPSFIESNRWYDEVGRTVGEWSPTSAGTKTTYDGLGRAIAVYVTDRGGDAGPGATGGYGDVFNAHASVLTSDVVFEQQVQAYATSGVPTLSTRWMRAHNATATGALSAYSGGSAAFALATYTAAFYDGALRPIRSASYGTNLSDDWLRTGGSAPSLSTVPDWNSSGNQIVGETRYDAKGRVDTVTDSTGRVTKYQYDMADRRIATIENWDEANPVTITWDGTSGLCWNVAGLDGTKPDVNRTTTFVYDGVGATTRLTAYDLPDATTLKMQHTDYHYGVVKGTGPLDSALNSGDLVALVVYPVESGLTPSQPFYTAYAYDLQGEATYMEEGKGTAAGGSDFSSKHSYTRDLLGRVTLDHATSIGTGISTRVNALLYAFDSLGRLTSAVSREGYAGSGTPGTVKDEVALAYTDLWQVAQIDQSPAGPLTYSGGTPTDFTTRTTYTYDTLPISGATQNYSRLSSITYPDGSVEGLEYGASTSTPDSRISRATGIRLGGTAIVTYARAGLDTVTDVDYRDPAVELDRYRSEAGTTTTGHYPGLDRFGRVRRQMWVDATFGAGSGGNPNRPPLVSLKYAYTKASDRTSAIDDRPGAGQPLSSGYEYDGLHRLVEARLGAASGGSVPVGRGSQRWREDDGTVTLDALGNWRRSWWDLDGSGAFSDTDELDARTHDVMNRIIGRTLAGQGSGGSDLDLGDLQYDNASNLSLWKRQAGTAAETWTTLHDAWNRLTDVYVGSSLRSRQAHNALHWRTYRFGDVRTTLGATPAVAPDGNLDQARFMHHGVDWRLLEERVDDDIDADAWKGGTYAASAIDRTQQHVWGLRYIDDAVLHRIDANKDGDYADAGDGTWYHLTDAQFSTVCLVKPDASVAERVSYSAYGIARHHWKGDVDGDGAVTVTGGTSDLGLVTAASGSSIGGSGYRAEYDLDRDGDVDAADQALVGGAATALPAGQLSSVSASGPDSQAGWDGYLYAAETGLYDVRFRTYEPGLGRWLERDPAGYEDGNSLYQAVASRPIDSSDWNGRKRIIAVLNGQDTFDLHGESPDKKWMFIHALVLLNMPWLHSVDNNVKFFQEDADWAPLPELARDWIKREYDRSSRCDTVVITGHSNGGDGARKVAAQLKALDIPVHLLFLFDPVGKPWHVGPDGVEPVSSNVRRAVDVRQTSDPRIGAGFGFTLGPIQVGPLMQGYQISPGENFTWVPNWTPPDQYDPDLYSKYGVKIYAHTSIVYQRSLEDWLNEEINNVPVSK